jgi:hypothetical protein
MLMLLLRFCFCCCFSATDANIAVLLLLLFLILPGKLVDALNRTTVYQRNTFTHTASKEKNRHMVFMGNLSCSVISRVS